MSEAVIQSSVRHGRPSDPKLDGRFIQAAVDLLKEHGYRALTTAAVAKRAGASTASLYRRWPTKRALVSDIARSLTLSALGNIDTGSLEGDLRELIRRKRRLLSRVGTPLLLMLAEATYDAELRDILEPEVIGVTVERLQSVIERAAARQARPVPSRDVLRILSLAVIGSQLVSHALSQAQTPQHDDDVTDSEVAMIMQILQSKRAR